MGVGLVRSLQPWDILLIYCNNLFKKYITPLLRLARGALSVPLLMSMSDTFSFPFLTIINLCYTKALEWSSLIPGPEAKSSSQVTKSDPVHHKLSIPQIKTTFTSPSLSPQTISWTFLSYIATICNLLLILSLSFYHNYSYLGAV